MHSSLRVKQCEIWVSCSKRAIFGSLGPCLEKLQELNTRIFKERFPLNKDFKLRGYENIELYDCVNKEKIIMIIILKFGLWQAQKMILKKEDLRSLKSESSNIIFMLILEIFWKMLRFCRVFENFCNIFSSLNQFLFIKKLIITIQKFTYNQSK